MVGRGGREEEKIGERAKRKGRSAEGERGETGKGRDETSTPCEETVRGLMRKEAPRREKMLPSSREVS